MTTCLPPRRRHARGFTMIELIVVMAIVALLGIYATGKASAISEAASITWLVARVVYANWPTIP